MNAFVFVLAAILAVTAGEYVVQKNHPNGAWEVQVQSDEPAQFVPIPIAYKAQPAPIPVIPVQTSQFEPTKKFIPILSQSQIHNPDGSFNLNYQSADGSSLSEQGSVKRNFENDGNVVVKSGHYAYIAPDGTPIALTWVADEYGFKATGTHLPKAPIPQ